MGDQRLRQSGALLVGAGVALLAGMVVVALTVPVTGYASVQVWVGVAAVALGPCWTGLVFLRSSRYQVLKRLGLPFGASLVLAAIAGFSVRDHYVGHPAVPVTVSAVANGVIAFGSVLLTVLATKVIEPVLTPDELDQSVDVRDLHTWGRRVAVLGGLFAVGLVATSVSGVLLFGVMAAGCVVASGVVLIRVRDLRAGHRSRVLVTVLFVVAMFSLVMAWPVVYGMFASSVIGAVLFAVQLIAALFAVVVAGVELARFLGRYGVLRPDGQVAR
ncbi:hypothetical protein AB0E59_26830 [Lentzea sp. NPDC034063]|uniref:hypothetical protein n=1 Tax=unclassified Lentzea TaxID=2643253 RepID=UPI0033DC4CAE